MDNGLTGEISSFQLNIRPEDLTRSDPSRLTVQQTLGNSAFVDNFGPGLATIVISGHTGWRGTESADGVALFQQLQQFVYYQWHALRDQARAAGQDPNSVKLIFADALDGFASIVAPNQFILKRSRARPLLMMYQITLTVLASELDAALAGDSEDDFSQFDSLLSQDQSTLGLESLQGSYDLISGLSAGDLASGSLFDPLAQFLETAVTTLNTGIGVIKSTAGPLVGSAADLMGLVADVSRAGRNALYTLGAIANPSDYGSQAELMGAASAFDNAYCVVTNVFSGMKTNPDFTDVYGASSCSSTSGGSPISPLINENAFETITPEPTTLAAVTTDAQSALDTLKITDPATLPMDADDLAYMLSTAAAGISFP